MSSPISRVGCQARRTVSPAWGLGLGLAGVAAGRGAALGAGVAPAVLRRVGPGLIVF